MWKQNNGQEDDELRFRFSRYLIQAIKRTGRDYLNRLYQYRYRETPTELIETAWYSFEQEEARHLHLWDEIESCVLLHALKSLGERERYVVLSRVLDDCPFDVLAVRLGLTYKGVAAIYYRAVQKLRKSIKAEGKDDI